jgi:hypothetical protein
VCPYRAGCLESKTPVRMPDRPPKEDPDDRRPVQRPEGRSKVTAPAGARQPNGFLVLLRPRIICILTRL